MLTAVTFVTIGQTPRTDLVPEIVAGLPAGVEVREVGALDGLAAEEVAALAPASGEARLVTRMADGSQAVVGKPWVRRRLQGILGAVEAGPEAVTVLLCTGEFAGLEAPGLFLHAQGLVDHGVAALCAGMRRIGLLLPLPEQADEFHWRPAGDQTLHTAFASPYVACDDDRFGAAGTELSGCDVVVMHCMGYTEGHRDRVAAASGRPVLLARRLVASGVAQLL